MRTISPFSEGSVGRWGRWAGRIDRQGEDEPVLDLYSAASSPLAQPDFPNAAVLGKAHQVPAGGGGNYVNAFLQLARY